LGVSGRSERKNAEEDGDQWHVQAHMMARRRFL
jgi:hypothetical protein